MKDLGEVSFVLGIEIHRDRRKRVLGLSQKAYIERILKKFSMHKCSPLPAPIVKGDRYRDFQCPRNQYEIDQIKAVPYASAVGSLQYAQVCTRPDLTFVTGLLGRFQSNPRIEPWKLVKKVLHYLQGMKGLIMTYRRSDWLHIVGYLDSDYARVNIYPDVDFSIISQRGAISWKSSKQTVTTSSTMYDSL